MILRALPACLFLLLCTPLLLLSQRPAPEDFLPGGEAIKTGPDCFRLTSAVQWASGSLWRREPIDLEEPFAMELELLLGCEDEWGADGIVFVFYSGAGGPRTGYRGEGMGFGGLSPSLGIEIDTWRNEHLADPAQDHMALLRDGQTHHAFSLAGPVRIPNVEDCRNHKLEISWEPDGSLLRVALDGVEYIRYRGNILEDVFRGQSRVYWGVTAATGRYVNRHEICFERLSFGSPGLPPLARKELLKGEIKALPHLDFPSGSAELPAEAIPALDDLARLLRENPKYAIEIFGHTDSAGGAEANRRLSERRAEAVAEYLIARGIPRKQVMARGYGEQYPIASNGTANGRKRNRRVEVHFFIPIP